MKRYLVGGCVRDHIIGRPFYEKDWVVCGSTPEEMLSRGFTQVGAFFPVFLHPVTKEEHALARTENKTSSGHKGFNTNTASVTLAEDLLRRDLTINAIARDSHGNIYDPYGGWRDIQSRALKHVSPAFIEDPLRVLRVARFAAQLAPWGFRVAPETIELMHKVVESGEMLELSAERVWKETSSALMSEKPSRYFTTLRECGALAQLFPEIDNLFGIPQKAEYHPEIDCGIHTMMVTDTAARKYYSLNERFAALVHDLGKAITPKDILPAHRGHERKGVPLVDALCKRLKVSNTTHTLAQKCCAEHLLCHKIYELRASTINDLFQRLDAWRNPQIIDSFAKVCTADALGRKGFENIDYSQARIIRQCFSASQKVDVAKAIEGITDNTKKPPAIREARISQIKEYLARLKSDIN